MAQRNRRKSKKNSQLTYEDIKNITPEQLGQMGLGSWLKDNVGNLATAVGGAALMFVPGGQAAGAGLLAGSVGGFANTAAQKDQQELQEKQILNQNNLNAANTDLQNKMNENPLVSYGVTMRRGGKLPKYQMGGPTTAITDTERGKYKEWIQYRDALGQDFVEHFKKGGIDLTESLSEYNTPNYKRTGVSEYVQNLISSHGDLAFDERLIKESLSKRGLDYNKYRELSEFIEKGPVNRDVYVQGIGEKEGEIARQDARFGYRQLLDTVSWGGEDYPTPLYGVLGGKSGLVTKSETIIPTEPKQMAMGGTINYGGQLHEGPDGGVPVDAQGNPNAQNPVALVEKGEVKYSTGEGDYIFSDQLELRKGKTFARRAKDVQSRYKMRMKDGVIADPIAKKGYDKEMGDLVQKQEKLRSIVAPEPNTYEGLPMGDRGLIIPDKINPLPGYVTTPSIMPTKEQFTKDINNVLADAPIENLYQGQTWGETGLQMIPGMLSGTANILMAGSRKRAMENMPSLNAPEVVPQQINLEAARAGIREQGNVARANTRRGLRGAASTAGQYMGNVGATETGVQRGVSEGLNQLNIQEETTNVGLRSSADALNAQMKARTQEMNAIREQQMLDAYYNQLAGGIGQIGQGITGALSTKAQSSQMANMMQMMQPNYKLTIDGNPIWGIGNKIRRTPRRG